MRGQFPWPTQGSLRCRRVAAPDGLKSEKKCRDPKITVEPAHKHPTATGAATIHAMTIPDTLACRLRARGAREECKHRPLHSGMLYALREVDRTEAFSRRTARRIMKQVAASRCLSRTIQPEAREPMPRLEIQHQLAICATCASVGRHATSPCGE